MALSLLYHLEFAWTWYGFLVGTSLITRVDCVFVSYSIACLLGLSFCLFIFYSISYTYLVLFFLSSILLSNFSIAWLNFFLSVIFSKHLESDSRGWSFLLSYLLICSFILLELDCWLRVSWLWYLFITCELLVAV